MPTVCQIAHPPQRTITVYPLPSYPWERVGADLFELKGANYLIAVDYFSRYPEVIKLTTTTSQSIVTALKSIFSRHGVPKVLVSDNGPHFSSREMLEFSNAYSFQHVTSSPRYPQSNGLAERTVKTMKSILSDGPDPYIALLSYRTTPLLFCNLSPSELLMGRNVRTDVPQVPSHLIPEWGYLAKFRQQDAKYKEQQQRNYNQRHRVRPLDVLPDETPVWIRTGETQTSGRVVRQANTPRSYWVSTPSGTIRRNRQHLNPIPTTSTPDIADDTYPEDTSNGNHADPTERTGQRTIMTRSRTGVQVRAPDRLHYFRKGDVA